MHVLKQHLFLDTIGCSHGRILLEFDPGRLSDAGKKMAEDLMGEWDWPARYGKGYMKSIIAPFGLRVEPENAELSGHILLDEAEPWERFGGLSASVLYDPDDGLYKLWYQIKQFGPADGLVFTDDNGHPAPFKPRVCYACSVDGVKWVRPELPYFRCDGRRTNIIDIDCDCGTIFLDGLHRETGKFKAFDTVYHEDRTDLTPHKRVFSRLRVSDNGLDWREVETEPLNYFFDTQNIMDFDEGIGLYVAYMRDHYNGRAISRCEFADPTRMPMPVTILYPDNDDPPDADYYTNTFTFYPHDRSIRLLFPTIYYQRTDQTTVRMGVSRNGRNFHWVSRDDIMKPGFYDGDFVAQMYPCPGMIAVGDRVALVVFTTNIGHDESRITTAYKEIQEERVRLRFACWERDRLAGLTSGQGTGEVCAEVGISGDNPRLQLNMRSSGIGRVSVEVLTGRCCDPAPGFAFGDGDGLSGDLRWADYQWGDHLNLEAFTGREITLRFRVENAKLFGFRIVTDGGGESIEAAPKFVSAL